MAKKGIITQSFNFNYPCRFPFAFYCLFFKDVMWLQYYVAEWYGCKMRKVCQMTRRRIGANSRDRNTRLELQPSADTGSDI